MKSPQETAVAPVGAVARPPVKAQGDAAKRCSLEFHRADRHASTICGATQPPPGTYDADVIILALNRPVETAAAVASVFAQTGISSHLTVVDQGSDPANLAALARLIDGRTDATLIALAENQGVAGGRNIASAFGRGRIIVALDNDAEFATSGTLARAVAALDGEADLAAIGFRIVAHDGGADDLSSWGYPRRLLRHAGETFDAVTFVGAGHAIRRAAWDDVGGYDVRLFFCWEEYDFCLRSIEHGWGIRYRGDIVVQHKVSQEQRMAWSGRRWFFQARNRLYIGRKHGAGWLATLARFTLYLLRALPDGAAWQVMRALPAAMRLARDVAPGTLSPATRNYLVRHNTARWGGSLVRLGLQVRDAIYGWPA